MVSVGLMAVGTVLRRFRLANSRLKVPLIRTILMLVVLIRVVLSAFVMILLNTVVKLLFLPA